MNRAIEIPDRNDSLPTNPVILEEGIPPLREGDQLKLEEFLRRWENMPGLKRAELIGGKVFMPSPLAYDHAAKESHTNGWMTYYGWSTPGVENGGQPTTLLGGDSPQPDSIMYILPEYGGAAQYKGTNIDGPPELVAEVSFSSEAIDLGEKFKLYEANGVQEYLIVLVRAKEIRWHRLVEGRYQIIPLDADGVYRSRVFPGLWLSQGAFFEKDKSSLLATLLAGIASPEHQAFVAELARRKTELSKE